MRISKGFFNQNSKVNTTICSEKPDFQENEKKYLNYFASKNMKIA